MPALYARQDARHYTGCSVAIVFGSIPCSLNDSFSHPSPSPPRTKPAATNTMAAVIEVFARRRESAAYPAITAAATTIAQVSTVSAVGDRQAGLCSPPSLYAWRTVVSGLFRFVVADRR